MLLKGNICFCGTTIYTKNNMERNIFQFAITYLGSNLKWKHYYMVVIESSLMSRPKILTKKFSNLKSMHGWAEKTTKFFYHYNTFWYFPRALRNVLPRSTGCWKLSSSSFLSPMGTNQIRLKRLQFFNERTNQQINLRHFC